LTILDWRRRLRGAMLLAIRQRALFANILRSGTRGAGSIERRRLHLIFGLEVTNND
jgi:hypothetical protein